MVYRQPVSLTNAQVSALHAVAAQLDPCWRERYIASVVDRLLWDHRDRPVTDSEVVNAIEGVKWAMFSGTIDDDD